MPTPVLRTEGLRTPKVIRTMPNTPVSVGQGVVVWTASAAVQPNEIEAVESMLAELGDHVLVQDEKFIDMYGTFDIVFGTRLCRTKHPHAFPRAPHGPMPPYAQHICQVDEVARLGAVPCVQSDPNPMWVWGCDDSRLASGPPPPPPPSGSSLLDDGLSMISYSPTRP